MAANTSNTLTVEPRSRRGLESSSMYPFGLPWLDSCYHQTLLPNGPWQDKIARKLCENLAPKLRKQLDIPKRRQMLIQLLGAEFVNQYMKDVDCAPQLLEEPFVKSAERRKLESDGENWLQHVLNQTASETGCQRPVKAEASGTVLSAEMSEYLEHTRKLLELGLDRHMYILEKQVIKAEELSKRQQRKSNRTNRLAELGKARVNIDWDSDNDSTTTSFVDRTDLAAATSETGAHGKQSSSLFWGHQSNCLGKSVVAMLRRDPRRLNQVTSQLRGRQLSGTLRSYIWMDVLQRHERTKVNDIHLESMLRERFAKAVTRGLTDLEIKEATHSPIQKVIEKAVSEIYQETPGMRLFMTKTVHLRESIKALNVLYIYDRTYEPYLVYWLFPLQLAFQRESGESEHTYELAMYLDLLNKGCFPKWPAIFSVAENVMSRMSEADPQFYQHLKAIALVNPKVNNKEFIAHLIRQEKVKASSYSSAESQVETESITSSKKLLADPLLFLRKWVGEGFVGVLDTPAVVFAWDQFFMDNWRLKTIEDMCLAIVFLLRDRFMMASDYSSMRKIFLSQPCRLYTADIQKSWIHIQQGGALIDIPSMNRSGVSQDDDPVNKVDSRTDGRVSHRDRVNLTSNRMSIDSLNFSENTIGPVGIGDISVELVISDQNKRKVPWVDRLDMSKIRLNCSICFGSVQLQTMTSTVPASLKELKTDETGADTYFIAFNAQRFQFRTMDLSGYDLEQEMGGYPFAILQVSYDKDSSNGEKPGVAIGWVQVRLYRLRQKAGNVVSWELVPGTKEYNLIPGASQLEEPQVVRSFIESSSQLQATVYEPSTSRG